MCSSDLGSSQKCRAARAAFRVRPAPQKPVYPAARLALHCLGQRVQASGTATEMVLGIISKSFAKDLTELLLFIIPFMTWNVVYYDRILYIMQKYYISDGGCHAH